MVTPSPVEQQQRCWGIKAPTCVRATVIRNARTAGSGALVVPRTGRGAASLAQERRAGGGAHRRRWEDTGKETRPSGFTCKNTPVVFNKSTSDQAGFGMKGCGAPGAPLHQPSEPPRSSRSQTSCTILNHVH